MNLKQILLSGAWASLSLTGCMAGPMDGGSEPGAASPGLEGSEVPVPTEAFEGIALTGPVSGTRVLHYRTDTGDYSEPVSPSTSPLQAFVVEAGARRYLTVSDPGNGTFNIPDAPPGQYFLQLGTFYVATDARSVSLDRYELGRRNRAVHSGTVTVKLNLTNLRPMVDGDWLSLDATSSNLGTTASLNGQGPVVGGGTSVTNFAADWSDYYGLNYILDGTKGDLLYVNQRSERSDGPIYYSAIERTFAAAPFTLSVDPAAPATISGEFMPLPVRSTRLEWWRSQFDAWRTTAHPLATNYFSDASLSPLPWGDDAWYGYVSELAYASVPSTGQDLLLDFQYGNPYLSWGTGVSVLHYLKVPVRLPGTTSGQVYATFGDNRPLRDDMGPIEMRISPPRALMVDGANAQVDRTLASRTPTISWTAPRVGTASAYRVSLRRAYTLSTSPTITRYSTVASFHTAGTSLTVPPGLLSAGERYVVSVMAYFAPGVDFARQPYVLEVISDAAFANSLSGILTAPTTIGVEERSEAPEGSIVAGPEVTDVLDAADRRVRLSPKAAASAL
jgi:hypothetical protein